MFSRRVTGGLSQGDRHGVSFHRSMMCAKCSSCAISSSVMFTMPRKRLNSAGTSLMGAGSSIDSVMNVTTICFCSRVMLFSNAVYGAIGVSLILCANVVIIEASLVSGGQKYKNNLKYQRDKLKSKNVTGGCVTEGQARCVTG